MYDLEESDKKENCKNFEENLYKKCREKVFTIFAK